MIKKEPRQFMNGLILICALLIQFTSCNEERSKQLQAKNSWQATQKDTPLNLKFTTDICSIFEDSNGNYWFGSQQEGVCLFDGKSLEYFTTNEGLFDNQIRSIREDKNGSIWFGTAKGVSSYNGGKITDHTPIDIGNSQSEWAKTANDLWFNAGNNEGVFRFEGEKLNYLAFPNPKVINPHNVYFVTDLAEGERNMLWIGTYAGIFGYDGSQFTIINDETLGLGKETGELHIRSILEDSKGRLWIGNNGIGVLLKDGEAIINFSEKNSLIHPTSSRRGDKSPNGTLEHVFAIEEDGEGNIWFGDRDTGAWKYDGKTMTNYSREAGLTDDSVITIYKDRDNDLWFGLADGNVFKFNGNTFDKQL